VGSTPSETLASRVKAGAAEMRQAALLPAGEHRWHELGAARVSATSIAPVDLKMPDWLVEALYGDEPSVGEPDALAAAKVVDPG
jgi:hypothetical protein